MPSERAGIAAAAVTFGGAFVWYWITTPHIPLWPPADSSMSRAGLWFVRMVAQIPVGDPMARVAMVAMVMAASAAAGAAWLIMRLGYSWPVAIGCALAVAFSPSSWRQTVGDAPGAASGVLIVCAVAIASLEQFSMRIRIGAVALAVTMAGALSPPVLAAAPLTLGRTVSRSLRVAIVGTLAGLAIAIMIAFSSPAPSAVDPLRAAVSLVRNEWLMVGTVLLVGGALSPLWGTPFPMLAVGGLLITACLMVLSRPAAALAIFPAMLMAHALGTLPGVGLRARIAGAIVLVFMPAMHRWYAPALDSWSLIAWRDAVERAVPRGTRIATNMRAAAALNGSLFAARGSRIDLVYAEPNAPDTQSAPFLLEDLRGRFDELGIRIEPVTLTFAGAVDFIDRLPRGTFVGIAVSERAAAEDPAAVAAVLRMLGHTPDGRARAVTAVGVSGLISREPRFAPGERNHVLLGELLDESGRRAPADFEVLATPTNVTVKLWGRELAAGRGWGVIAIGARGPLIGAYSTDDARAMWRIEVPGLGVWRAASGGS